MIVPTRLQIAGDASSFSFDENAFRRVAENAVVGIAAEVSGPRSNEPGPVDYSSASTTRRGGPGSAGGVPPVPRIVFRSSVAVTCTLSSVTGGGGNALSSLVMSPPLQASGNCKGGQHQAPA